MEGFSTKGGRGIATKPSRRGMIIDMLDAKKSDAEILRVLDKEFPPGYFKSSNEQALAGTKWDVGHTVPRGNKIKPVPYPYSPQMPTIQTPELMHTELVRNLKAFQPEPIIQRYRQRELLDKSPAHLVDFTMGASIYRAFRYESPSQRYRNWRWYNNSANLLSKLNAAESQAAFDLLATDLGQSLVDDWGGTNERGKPSRMNIGVAMKIVNLLLKHLAFSNHCHNTSLIPLLHVPWDSFTLRPLRSIWQGHPPIPEAPSQGFVKELETYLQLHRLITDIAREIEVPRIYYEFWAWDAAH